MPKPFKKTYEDKMGEWIERYKREGMSLNDVQNAINQKKVTYMGKYGNRSSVGDVLATTSERKQQALAATLASPRHGGGFDHRQNLPPHLD